MEKAIVDYRSIEFPVHNFIQIASVDGESNLYNYRFPAYLTEYTQVKGVILIFHGYGSYMQRYSHIA